MCVWLHTFYVYVVLHGHSDGDNHGNHTAKDETKAGNVLFNKVRNLSHCFTLLILLIFQLFPGITGKHMVDAVHQFDG